MDRIVLLATLLLLTTAAAFATPHPHATPEQRLQQTITVDEFMDMSPQEMEQATGQKFSFAQKVGLKVFKRKIKRKLKWEAAEDVTIDFTLAEVSAAVGLLAALLFWFPVLGLILAAVALTLAIISIMDEDINLFNLLGLILSGAALLLIIF